MTAAAASDRPRRLLPLPAPERLLLVLLVFIPLAAIGEWQHWGALTVFVFASLAIIPLAGLMGSATETLAHRFGAGVGGLLNATFGNAAELIIALAALQHGLHDVVKASLTGSIIGNSLLVLGLAILLGGLGRERQSFDRSAAGIGGTLLALAAIGFVVPTLFHLLIHRAEGPPPEHIQAIEHGLSLPISLVLLVSYLLSLVFTLRTHRHLYAGRAAEAPHHHPAGGTGRSLIVLLVA